MRRINKLTVLLCLAVCLMQPFPVFAESETQKITYLSSFSFPPYRHVAENEEYVGFEVDAARLIFRDSPYGPEFQDFLLTDKLDEAFDATGADCFGWHIVSEESKKLALMSEPFYFLEFCAYGLDENYKEIQALTDLKGLRVAVRANAQPQILLNESDVPFVSMPTGEHIARALINGEIDIAFDECRSMEHLLSRLTHMGNITVYESVLHKYPVGLAFNPDRPDLKEYADGKIAQLKTSGELENLYYKYFGRHTLEFFEHESTKKRIFYICASVVSVLLLAILLLKIYTAGKRRHEHKTRMSTERYNLLLGESEIILMDFDSDRKILAYSESAVKLLDIPDSADNFHANFRKCVHPDDLPAHAHAIDRVYSGDADFLIEEIRVRTASKKYEYFLTKARALVDSSGKPRVCGILININEQKLLQSEMERTLNYDGLTGAMNRGKFISECDKILAENNNINFVLIYMDIDHLAKINNLCGYPAGDSVLKQVVAAVFSCIGDRLCVFGRIGNDDFALLTSAQAVADVESLFRQISDKSARISVGLEIRIPVRIYGGFAFPENGDTILSLLTKAGAAQKTAKSRGETLVDYKQNVKFFTLDRDELSRDIIEAYENNDLEVWYQPKINLKTKKLVGMEALLRWNHHEKGEIPPSVFIELAEQMDFIKTLDTWVLTQACIQNKAWQDKGFPHVRISANVSKVLLKRGDPLKAIIDILEQTGLDSHYLDIELTESLAVSDPDNTVKILKQLRKIGVTVSMDDFGSGYASLATLKMLPFDALKIDRSLITDVDKNMTSRQIIKAIVDISRSLGLDIVAEGAESASQVQCLEELGCDIIQGYYFGKALPADKFEVNFEKFG